MRLIDADKIYVIPAEDDNITGMGMTREEQDAYNKGIDAVMEKIRNAETVDAVPYDTVLEVIDKVSHKASARGGFWTAEKTIKVLRRDVLALKGDK